MVGVMPQRKKPTKMMQRGERVQGFFTLTPEDMEKLDELADAAERSRGGQVAFLIRQHIEAEYPKLEERRRGTK